LTRRTRAAKPLFFVLADVIVWEKKSKGQGAKGKNKGKRKSKNKTQKIKIYWTYF